jgi:hypothetical protein
MLESYNKFTCLILAKDKPYAFIKLIQRIRNK